MNIDEKDNPEYKELYHFVKNGEYSQIDDWFRKHSIASNPDVERKLAYRILNESYFFAFQSMSFDKEYLEEERTKREVAILKNLTLENQVLLFSVAAIDDVKSAHFQTLKITSKEDNDFLKSSLRIAGVLTKLFSEENFSELDKIQQLFSFKIMEHKSNGVIFMHREPGVIGSLFFKIDKPIFSPKHGIIFEFSETKKSYLQKNNIELPTLEETKELYDEMRTQFLKDSRPDDIVKINSAFKNYEVYKSYWDLNNELNEKYSTSKRHKL